MKKNIHIVIPVFNEEGNIPTLVDSLKTLQQRLADEYILNFIAVDDGSGDETVARMEAATDLDIKIIVHGVNKGPGKAFASAFEYLSDKLVEEDWIITMEGDNTSRVELIQQMLQRSREGYDVILASPYMYGGGFTETSLFRRILSSGANLVVKDLLGIQGILTVSSFFRLYRGSVVKTLQAVYGPGILERSGFESMVELIMKLIVLKTSISEVPMELNSSLRKGKSKMNIRRTIFGYLALWRCKKRWAAKTRM